MSTEQPIVEGTEVSRTSTIMVTDHKREAVRSDADVCNAMLETFLDSPEAVKEFLDDFAMRMERLNTNPMFRRRLAQDVMKQVDFRTRIMSEMIAVSSKGSPTSGR